jgi:hypothetical protein
VGGGGGTLDIAGVVRRVKYSSGCDRQQRLGGCLCGGLVCCRYNSIPVQVQEEQRQQGDGEAMRRVRARTQMFVRRLKWMWRVRGFSAQYCGDPSWTGVHTYNYSKESGAHAVNVRW